MRRELLLPLAAAGVAVLFVGICALVIITRNDPRWVQRKLRVGALLLTLTPACGQLFGNDDDVVTCYAAPPQNTFQVEGSSPWDDAVPIDLGVDENLDATIEWRDGELFSYRFTDADGGELARGDLDAADGAFDESSEEFVIPLPVDLAAGSATLYLFETRAADQPVEPTTVWEWQLDVTGDGNIE